MARYVNYGSLIAWSFVLSFFLGLLVLMPVLLVLYASPSGPSFSINLSYNQALNMTRENDSATKFTIDFDLKLKNENEAIGLHYPDPINVTFSYFPNVSFLVVLAEYKLDRFYQGNGKTRHVRDVVEANVFPTALEGTDMIAFRVDLVGTFRYKKAGTKRHKVELGCVVGVDYTTSKNMQTGFIGLVEPGLDSKLKKKPPPDYVGP
ncbi:hypothetical protein L2E82_40805 [Cichorium intybus]|uniref:Uncharacterized protein n=1 Tax=Cichorium intybus TaxID=13427 RepID=A0ACB9ALT7_CICIN|nr:hypothetical protein L2E82_40805 [Cichorium intybus]